MSPRYIASGPSGCCGEATTRRPPRHSSARSPSLLLRARNRWSAEREPACIASGRTVSCVGRGEMPSADAWRRRTSVAPEIAAGGVRLRAEIAGARRLNQPGEVEARLVAVARLRGRLPGAVEPAVAVGLALL